jgi:hypothetical protein
MTQEERAVLRACHDVCLLVAHEEANRLQAQMDATTIRAEQAEQAGRPTTAAAHRLARESLSARHDRLLACASELLRALGPSEPEASP